jgi:hypothetical protein
MSPAAGWLIFGAWVIGVVLVMAFFMGARRLQDKHLESCPLCQHTRGLR